MRDPMPFLPQFSQRDIIVVGASAGGVHALCELCRALPPNLPASVFAVIHIGAHPSAMPDILTARGPLQARHPVDGERPEKGIIYIAPPDHHMLLHEERIQLTRGPKEHHTRPAVDPLFRSAALSYGPRTIGVVLTGHLDDGTAGMQAIKECGGLVVVQDPATAEAPSMPVSVLENVTTDHCVRLEHLASTLVKLTRDTVPSVVSKAPQRLIQEHEASTSEGNIMEHLELVARPSTLVCPECTGTLWEIKESKPPRYRCHTGHAYSLQSLRYQQANGVEASLWSAVRALQDHEQVSRLMANLCRENGADDDAELYQQEAEQLAMQALVVEKIAHGKTSQGINRPSDATLYDFKTR